MKKTSEKQTNKENSESSSESEHESSDSSILDGQKINSYSSEQLRWFLENRRKIVQKLRGQETNDESNNN